MLQEGDVGDLARWLNQQAFSPSTSVRTKGADHVLQTEKPLGETGVTQEIPFKVLFYQAVVLTDTSSGKYILPC